MKKDKLYIPVEDYMPKTPWELVLYSIKPFRLKLAAFFGLTLIGIIGWNTMPYLLSIVVNRLAENPVVDKGIWVLVIAYSVVHLIDEFTWRTGEVIVRSVKPNIMERTRASLFSETLKRPHAYFSDNSSGRISHWINESSSQMGQFLDTTFWNFWGAFMNLFTSAFFLYFTHWSLMLLFVGWLAAIFTFTTIRGKKFSKLVADASDERSIASSMIVDTVSNTSAVKINNHQDKEMHSLMTQERKIVKAARKSWRHSIITNAVKGQSSVIAQALAVTSVVYLYSKGHIEIGAILLFVSYFGAASGNLWNLSWTIDNYFRIFGTIQNALDGLNGESERTGETTPASKLPKTVDMELSSVDFAYPDQPNDLIIKDLKLTVAAGEKVGIVGHSGAGKSTLIGLLLGFYDPTSGSILINGDDTTGKDPSFVRAVSAFVPQDTSLFNRTIRENVVYAKPKATKKQLIAALKKAEAYDFVKKLPNGLDTLIGERGVKLSGGQRQRIAIARAILKDSPLLLLDEATSALDSVSEQAIQKALHNLMQKRTAIVIAHRLSTLKHLDRIVVIEKGSVAEQGSHEELLKQDGIYADLWRRQKDGFLTE